MKIPKIAAAVGMLWMNLGLADASLRCGNQVVSIGDSRAVVRHKCGAADDIARSIVTKRVLEPSNGRIRFAYRAELEIQVESESWLYNFGANRLMTRLRFVDGRLEFIETLGYGYDRDTPEQ